MTLVAWTQRSATTYVLYLLWCYWNRLWYAKRLREQGFEDGKLMLKAGLKRCADLRLAPALARPLPPFRYVCLAGGGFKAIAYAGYTHYLAEHGLVDASTHWMGTSLGGVYAVLMAASKGTGIQDPAVGVFAAGMLQYCIDVRRRWFSMFGQFGNALAAVFWSACDSHPHLAAAMTVKPSSDRHSSRDTTTSEKQAHKLSGNVTLGLTRMPSPVELFRGVRPHQVTVSLFNGPSDVLAALIATTFIPLWTTQEIATGFRGEGSGTLDGGLTDPQATPQPGPKQLSEAGGPGYKLLARRHGLTGLRFMWRIFVPPSEDAMVEEIVVGYKQAHADVCAALALRNDNY